MAEIGSMNIPLRNVPAATVPKTIVDGLVYLTVTCCLLLGVACARSQREPLPCPERAVFGDPAESPYLLPYPTGRVYWLDQSYCHANGGHKDQLAYDFLLPVGDAVTAARAGTVKEVKDDLPDEGKEPDAGQHNHIMIQHEDGTVAFYAHLMQASITVKVGDQVEAGQTIAKSGNSGNTMGTPHLHFGVYASWPPVEGFDLAINFKNAGGELDNLGGLIAGNGYKAMPN
jgi:murein DD-endopeptidase MepM/ murein hydrolase activator NlpD